MYDNIIDNLKKRQAENSFFHMTGSQKEKKYIRSNNCIYKTKFVYGGEVAIIRDKKTGDTIELQLFRS